MAKSAAERQRDYRKRHPERAKESRRKWAEKRGAEYQREWKKRNPNKQREYNQRWNENNPGRSAAASRQWYHKNKDKYNPTRHRKNKTPEELDKLKAQDKISREKHRDKRNAETRAWCERNIEHRRAYAREWAKTPQGKVHYQRNGANRRARKKVAEGSFTAEDIKDLYATQGARCYYCSVEIENGYHIEHMVPLSRGGRNDVSNICLACAPCNLKKHTKTAEEFKGEQDEEVDCVDWDGVDVDSRLRVAGLG